MFWGGGRGWKGGVGNRESCLFGCGRLEGKWGLCCFRDCYFGDVEVGRMLVEIGSCFRGRMLCFD